MNSAARAFFTNLLGADNAYFDEAHRTAYCYDATKRRCLPDGVLFPRSEDDVSQILKAFSIKFERSEDLLLNLFEWLKILNEVLGYEIFFFINLENFLSEEELLEFSKFILYNKYKVVFLENFCRNKLFDDDSLIVIDNDLCEVF